MPVAIQILNVNPTRALPLGDIVHRACHRSRISPKEPAMPGLACKGDLSVRRKSIRMLGKNDNEKGNNLQNQKDR